MHDFWQMGGYAAYVWSSYGIAAVVLGVNMVWPYWRLRILKREILEASEDD